MRKYALLGFLIVVLILPFLAHSQTVIRVQRITASGTASPTPTPTPWPCSDFSDDFSAGTLDARWVEGSQDGNLNTTAVVLTTNPNLILTVQANPGGAVFNGALTAATHDMSNGYFAAKIVQLPDNTSTLYDTSLSVGLSTADWTRWAHEQGQFYMQKKVGGTPTTIGNIPYDGSAPLWLRIREDSGTGTTYWESSTDGLTWTDNHHEADLWAVTSLKYNLNTGANSSGTHISAVAKWDDACAE